MTKTVKRMEYKRAVINLFKTLNMLWGAMTITDMIQFTAMTAIMKKYLLVISSHELKVIICEASQLYTLYKQNALLEALWYCHADYVHYENYCSCEIGNTLAYI